MYYPLLLLVVVSVANTVFGFIFRRDRSRERALKMSEDLGNSNVDRRETLSMVIIFTYALANVIPVYSMIVFREPVVIMFAIFVMFFSLLKTILLAIKLAGYESVENYLIWLISERVKYNFFLLSLSSISIIFRLLIAVKIYNILF